MMINKEKNNSEKFKALLTRLKKLGKVAVAFSGGVDSTFLLYAAKEAVGAENVLALTADSQLLPREDVRRATSLAETLGVELQWIKIDALSNPDVAANGPKRCYYCKKAVFSALKEAAQAHGIHYLLDGSNVDDRSDYRPGRKATEELAIVSPLSDADLTKAEIRQLSANTGLPTASLPAYACLATRVMTGTPLDAQTLEMIEIAESNLHKAGFIDVRVRAHGDCARIELPQAVLEKAMEQRSGISVAVKTAGFRYVALDCEGYRMGSSNKEANNGQP